MTCLSTLDISLSADRLTSTRFKNDPRMNDGSLEFDVRELRKDLRDGRPNVDRTYDISQEGGEREATTAHDYVYRN